MNDLAADPARPGQITQADLDRIPADLVVYVNPEGDSILWSSEQSRSDVAAILRLIADDIEDGSL